MSIVNIGSLVLQSVVFVTTLVNFNTALLHVEPMALIGLYIFSKLFARTPDDFCLAGCLGPFEEAINGYVTPREDNCMSSASPLESGQLPERRFNHHMHQTPSPASLARMLSNARKDRAGKKVSLRDRICCHQWNWFTMTMATGGVANVLHTVPYKSQWLYYVGVVFTLFNVSLFVTNCGLVALRFALSPPGSFTHSFTDQMECLFIPSIVVSSAIILINFCQYGFPETGSWLQSAIEVLYWIYIPFSVIASCGMYLILWSTQIFPIHTMTPAWVFPAYPLLLSATFAGNIISGLDPSSPVVSRRLAIALAGLTAQGTGFLISFLISAAFMYRLMTQKLPRDTQRPGVFISIGPPGFTCGGILMLGSSVNQILPDDLEGRVYAQYSLKFMSIVMGLWFWGLTIWFFMVSVGSLHKYVRKGYAMPFQMNWWSFVFPNTAMVSATFGLAKAFDNDALRIVGCVKAGILVLVWFLVFVRMIKGLWERDIMFPKDPEKD